MKAYINRKVQILKDMKIWKSSTKHRKQSLKTAKVNLKQIASLPRIFKGICDAEILPCMCKWFAQSICI